MATQMLQMDIAGVARIMQYLSYGTRILVPFFPC